MSATPIGTATILNTLLLNAARPTNWRLKRAMANFQKRMQSVPVMYICASGVFCHAPRGQPYVAWAHAFIGSRVCTDHHHQHSSESCCAGRAAGWARPFPPAQSPCLTFDDQPVRWVVCCQLLQIAWRWRCNRRVIILHVVLLLGGVYRSRFIARLLSRQAFIWVARQPRRRQLQCTWGCRCISRVS